MKKRASVFVCFLLVAMLVSCGTAAVTNASNPTGAIGMDPLSFTAVDNSMFDTSDIYCAAYGDGKFIAGGDDGKISYSTDGVNWNTVNDSKFDEGSIFDICYGDGKFVAVGFGAKIAYSTDGITWTLVEESPFISEAWVHERRFLERLSIGKVIYGNGKFIACGGQNSIIAHSNDGIIWTKTSNLSFPFNFAYISSIDYDGIGNYLAVSCDRVGKTMVIYSNDGIMWTSYTEIPILWVNNSTVKYGGEKFFYATRHILAYTLDGKQGGVANGFNMRNDPSSIFGNSNILAFEYGNGVFICGSNDGKMAYSTDGLTWSLLTDSAFGTTQINDIAFGDGKFVAVGNGGKIAYSR